MTSNIQIRPIAPSDNLLLAKVIRDALTEFGANKPGTVFFDPTTDALYELFQTKGSAYFIAEENGTPVTQQPIPFTISLIYSNGDAVLGNDDVHIALRSGDVPLGNAGDDPAHIAAFVSRRQRDNSEAAGRTPRRAKIAVVTAM